MFKSAPTNGFTLEFQSITVSFVTSIVTFTDEFVLVISTTALLSVVFRSAKRKTVEFDSDWLNIIVAVLPKLPPLSLKNSLNQSAYTGVDRETKTITVRTDNINFFFSII